MTLPAATGDALEVRFVSELRELQSDLTLTVPRRAGSRAARGRREDGHRGGGARILDLLSAFAVRPPALVDGCYEHCPQLLSVYRTFIVGHPCRLRRFRDRERHPAGGRA